MRRRVIASLCYRCDWFAPGGDEAPGQDVEGCGETTIDPYDPNRRVGPESPQRGVSGSLVRLRPCQESGADAPRTRGTLGVSGR